MKASTVNKKSHIANAVNRNREVHSDWNSACENLKLWLRFNSKPYSSNFLDANSSLYDNNIVHKKTLKTYSWYIYIIFSISIFYNSFFCSYFWGIYFLNVLGICYKLPTCVTNKLWRRSPCSRLKLYSTAPYIRLPAFHGCTALASEIFILFSIVESTNLRCAVFSGISLVDKYEINGEITAPIRAFRFPITA